MDSRDRLPPFVNGVECAVCGRTVPRDAIRILASRDDLTFVELACAACRSESLGIVVAADSPDGDAAPETYGEFLPSDAERFREALPIDVDDVARVRAILASRGIVGLVDSAAGPDDGGRRP